MELLLQNNQFFEDFELGPLPCCDTYYYLPILWIFHIH